VKKLNAEKKAREKKRLEMLLKQEAKFKDELKQKEE
jgi:hypothetical protein